MRRETSLDRRRQADRPLLRGRSPRLARRQPSLARLVARANTLCIPLEIATHPNLRLLRLRQFLPRLLAGRASERSVVDGLANALDGLSCVTKVVHLVVDLRGEADPEAVVVAVTRRGKLVSSEDGRRILQSQARKAAHVKIGTIVLWSSESLLNQKATSRRLSSAEKVDGLGSGSSMLACTQPPPQLCAQSGAGTSSSSPCCRLTLRPPAWRSASSSSPTPSQPLLLPQSPSGDTTR